jgi:hypothetical protein
MRITSVVVACFLILSTVQAAAANDWYSGNELLSACESKEAVGSGVCLGYIQGVHSTTMLNPLPGSKFKFCTPEGMVAEHLKDVVVEYLRNNPSSLHYAAVSLVIMAVSEAFPCR